MRTCARATPVQAVGPLPGRAVDALLRPPALIVSGVNAADLDGLESTARRVGIGRLHSVVRRLGPPFVLVLGDVPLQQLRPATVGPLLRGPGCASFGCAVSCPAPVVAAWARECPMEFVPRELLGRRLSVACGPDGVLTGERETPVIPEGNEAMWNALLVLQRQGDLGVKSWACALGVSRFALWRLCSSTLGLTPEEVAWQILHVRVRRGVAHGRSDSRIAASVGYASGFTLRRAYATRELPFPRR